MNLLKQKYSKYRTISDSSLIDVILDGDMTAVEFLLSESCAPGFYRLCQIYRGSGIDFEDLTQEMCIQLFRNDWQMLRDFRGVNTNNARSCKLITYIITCASRWMKRKNDATVHVIDWLSVFAHGDDRSIELSDNGRDAESLKSSVIDAIMALPDNVERLVLLEYKIKDRPPEEVARLINEKGAAKGTVENVYTICSRAMNNLRKQMKKGDVYV